MTTQDAVTAVARGVLGRDATVQRSSASGTVYRWIDCKGFGRGELNATRLTLYCLG